MAKQLTYFEEVSDERSYIQHKTDYKNMRQDDI